MRWFVVLVAVFLFSCSGQDAAVEEDGGQDAARWSDIADASAQDRVRFAEVHSHDVVPETSVAEVDAGVDSFIPGPACEPGEGCFLDPCTENGDCLSGWCVEHLGEGVCSKACQEDCPDGWSCRQIAGTEPDIVYLCVSNFARLCRPCGAGSDCVSLGGVESVCVDYGAEGSFCGGTCQEDGDCPWGFSCKDVLTVDGFDTRECVADAGVCPCTDEAVELALWTPCVVENDWGICEGQRVCTEDGLSECNAGTPSAEACDGVDNDCDGEVDEPPVVEGEYLNLCDDGNMCTADSCQGADGCTHEVLDGAECLDGDPCTTADVCHDDVCQGTPVICNDDNPCTDDLCAEDGGCLFAPNEVPCDDGDPCTVGDLCGEGTCHGTALPCQCHSDEDCLALEDGDLCNGTLVCALGSLPYQCIVDPDTVVNCPQPEGTDAFCLAAACDPDTAACSFSAQHEGFLCDDGDACTAGESCQQGSCLGGEAVNCADNNVCTDDTCDAAMGCLHTPNTAACNDGDVCTTDDACVAGLCQGGPALVCQDDNPCTDDACDGEAGCQYTPNSLPCDDGNACTSGEVCAAGQCQGGQSVSCGDDNPCTDDGCDPVLGCVYENNVAPCDDGNACTLEDHCQEGLCTGGAPPDCDDANPCTDDVCDPDAGCIHTLNQAPCDDGNLCTTGDVCQDGLCVYTALQSCADDNFCTDDACDPAVGCVHTPNVAPCNDGDLCTVGDLCALGACEAGVPLDCDDGNLCTDDACDPAVGCVHSLNQMPCNDGDACTTEDQCVLGECVGGPPLNCDDGNPCTDDACSPELGCVQENNENLCDDGDECTTADACAGGTCIGGPAPDCDDGNPCTADGCDAELGCQHQALLDGTLCNGGCGSTCQAGQCVSGLVARYTFTGNTHDTSGGAHHATNHGASLTTDRAGKAKQAYSFDGSNDYMTLPTHGPLNLTHGSLSIWAQSDVTSLPSYYKHLMAKRNLGNDVFGFQVKKVINTMRGLVALASAPNLNKAVDATSTLNKAWHHYVITHDGTTLQFYRDNVLQGTDGANGPMATEAFQGWSIGYKPSALHNYWDGKIDDIHIFDYALSPAEVEQLYNGQCN